MHKPNWPKAGLCLIALWLAAAIAVPAQTFRRILNFNGTNGANPQFVNLVQGLDGDLYGTAEEGGAYGFGTAFKLSRNRVLTTIYSFCAQLNCVDGGLPFGGLVLGSDGNFYGTTSGGGNGFDVSDDGSGTVFRITPAGSLTTLYKFCSQPFCTDGVNPDASLVRGTDGDFYGTTAYGGTSGNGTVFKITPDGTLRTLHNFNDFPDGTLPAAPLLLASDGSFYGTTIQGAMYDCGTVFKITSAGTFTTVHIFDGTDGCDPRGPLIEASDGNLYGTSGLGGAYGGPFGDGTIFKMSFAGVVTSLYSFNVNDGSHPTAGLTQATDGNLYGTTGNGGADATSCFAGYGCGTLFQFTSDGTLTTLHSFHSNDGSDAESTLVQATNGTLYGVTTYGGNGGTGYFDGTIFSLAIGVGPFVQTVPTFGKTGAALRILGNGLVGTTNVSFNGTPATFTVESATAIKATVPAGATTGPVQVVTPKGTLTSNVSFQVLP